MTEDLRRGVTGGDSLSPQLRSRIGDLLFGVKTASVRKGLVRISSKSGKALERFRLGRKESCPA